MAGNQQSLLITCPKPDSVAGWLAMLDQPQADRDYQPGHERMHRLLSRLELKKPAYRIRIAGTNGKGSTAHMTANALQAAGLKVGLFTSPHILHFNERIRIHGLDITDEQLAHLLELLVPTALEMGASYFETATAIALQAFSDACVDVEILEAGVGARFDSTTSVPADMALLTPVGLDHQNWLGDTLIRIADEKSWIFSGFKSCYSAPQNADVMRVLKEKRADLQVVLALAEQPLRMLGQHQKGNAALALAAAEHVCGELLVHCDDECLSDAVAYTLVPGRLHKVNYQHASIWLDAGHNMHAIEALMPAIARLADPLDAILVFTREDRSLDDALPMLKAAALRIVVSRRSDPVHGYADVIDGLESVLMGKKDAKILVLGSFTTVARVLNWLKERS